MQNGEGEVRQSPGKIITNAVKKASMIEKRIVVTLCHYRNSGRNNGKIRSSSSTVVVVVAVVAVLAAAELANTDKWHL